MSSPEWKCRRGLLKLVAFLFYLSLAVLFEAQVEANVVVTTAVRGARSRRDVTGSSRVECVNAQNRPLSHRIFCLSGCKSSSATSSSSSSPSQSASASIEPPPTVIRAKSVREFVQKCKPNNGNSNQQANHLSQILTKTIRNETLFERRRENGQTATVFVLDFRLVTGSVYIDFKSSPAMLKPEQQLILNVVTKQFVTFRLLNVPSRARIRVLVNGEARVSYVEKKDMNEANLASTVEIWHAPLYDRFANRSEWVAYLERSTGVYIRRYVEYLNLFCHLSHLRIDLDLITQLASGEQFADQQLVEYMEMEDPSESLLQICSLNESPTQEQSQNAMSDSRTNSLSSQDSGSGGNNRNSAPFWSGRGGGNPLSFLQSINTAGAYASFSNPNSDLSFLSSGGSNFRPNILDIDTYEFYMFEIEHDEAHDFDASPNHFLRLFIDECDFNKKYILILYINLKNSSDSTPIRKKIILDDFDCPIRAVYSNAEVFDQLNLLYHQWNYLNVTKIIQDYKNANMNGKTTTTTNAFSDDDIRDKLAYILPYDLNFSLNNTFYYLKITKTANDIELIFLSAEGRLTLAHNKFFNKLNQQTFVSSSSSMSNSMKFVLKEHDILEYFKENHLKLDSFLHSDKKAPSNLTRLILAQNGLMRQRDSRFFFISSHRCPVIFLSSILMVDQIDNYLLLFDSKLYDNQSNTDGGVTTSNDCFYYEKSTESFYATFGFAINELTFRNSFYFTIKQQLEKPKENNNKNPLYSLSSLNNIKEKAVDEYFMNVIHSTIKLNYTVQSSARLLAMSHESSALEADLWQQHNSNRHRKNRLKDDFNAKQKPSPPPTVKPPQPKPAHVELDVHIRLAALDDSIAWRLDSCWFNDNFCINKLETTMNSFDGGGSVKPDVNYAGVGAGNANSRPNNSGEHYQEEFAEEEDMEDDYDDEDMDTAMVNSHQRMRDYDHVEENGWSDDDDDGNGESYYEHLIEDNPTPPPPPSTRRNRKSRNQPNMISYELKSSSISFEKSPSDQLFVFSARFTLLFNPLLNVYSKPYILCNMKPYAAPCSSSDDSDSSSSSLNGSSHDSNHCDEKSSSSKAAKFMEREKAAGNKVKTIVLTKMRRAEPSNASTSEPEMKFAFDSTQHLAPNKNYRLPDCTWFVRYYNDNTNNANGSQQNKDAKNNKTANLSASSNITTTTSISTTTTSTSTTTSSANANTTNNNARYNATTTANTFYNTNTTISNNDDDDNNSNNNNNYNQNLPLPSFSLPFAVSWLLDWAHANLFTIVLVVLFVVCLVGFIVLLKLVFFRDCNLCSKLVLFKKPSNGQNGSSSSAANQNGTLMAIDAEQQLSLLDHKVPDHQPPGNGNLSKHIIIFNSTHENNHLISNRQQKSEATTNHL